MNTNYVIIAMVVAMVAVVAVLGMGLFTMVSGKDVSGRTSNKLMWWRIYLQAGALGLFALVMYLVKG